MLLVSQPPTPRQTFARNMSGHHVSTLFRRAQICLPIWARSPNRPLERGDQLVLIQITRTVQSPPTCIYTHSAIPRKPLFCPISSSHIDLITTSILPHARQGGRYPGSNRCANSNREGLPHDSYQLNYPCSISRPTFCPIYLGARMMRRPGIVSESSSSPL